MGATVQTEDVPSAVVDRSACKGRGVRTALWPIRYKPLPDELLSSWLVRLAHGHGLKVQTFCNLIFGNRRQVWKPWQPQVLQDQLTEMGPSESSLDATKYAYLEFRDGGRVHNVGVMSDLVSKLKQSLGKEGCTFHLLHGENLQTKDSASMVIAVGEADGVTYAVDMKRRGVDVTLANTRKARTMGRVLQYMGLALALVGIPMIMVFVGFFMIAVGIFMWRGGKKMAMAYQYQMDLLERQVTLVSRIPGVRLL